MNRDGVVYYKSPYTKKFIKGWRPKEPMSPPRGILWYPPSLPPPPYAVFNLESYHANPPYNPTIIPLTPKYSKPKSFEREVASSPETSVSRELFDRQSSSHYSDNETIPDSPKSTTSTNNEIRSIRSQWLSMLREHAETIYNKEYGKSPTVYLDSIHDMTKKIHMNLTKQALQKLLESTVKTTNLDRKQFISFYQQVMTQHRRQMFKLYKRCAGAGGGGGGGGGEINRDKSKLPYSRMLHFLRESQKEEWKPENVSKMLYGKPDNPDNIDGYTWVGYLSLETTCNWMQPEHAYLYQDMTQPLSNYYISSAVVGPTGSLATYKFALEQGYRYLELAIRDGASEPSVPLQPPCDTMTLLRTIGELAFTASSFPVLLYLDVWCEPQTQELLVECIWQTIGYCLFVPHKHNPEKSFLSPERLKNMIVLVGRKQPLIPSLAELLTLECVSWDGAQTAQQLMASTTNTSIITIPSGTARDQIYKDKGCKQLFQNRLGKADPHGIHTSRTPGSMLEYNAMIEYWYAGVQIIPLDLSGNTESHRRLQMVSDARFSINGGSGYVLKNMKPFSPRAHAPSATTMRWIMSIRILEGWNLPPPRNMGSFNPSIVVLVHSGKYSESKQTKVVDFNGFNPEWDQEFVFEVSDPSVTLVLFRVMSTSMLHQDECVAEACMPMSSVRNGYRTVNLVSTVTGATMKLSQIFCLFDLRSLVVA